MTLCAYPDCPGPGVIDESGFCDECGRQPESPASQAAPAASVGAPSGSRPSGGGASGGGASVAASVPTAESSGSSAGTAARGTASTARGTTTTTGGGASRGKIGVGLVSVPPVPYEDPRAALMRDPEIPEHERFCPNPDCKRPVGRTRDGVSGRITGFCPFCGTRFHFGPRLEEGDVVGQYKVHGSLARGGLGWIYLAEDLRLEGNWVVLKGLLDTTDRAALEAAVAERRFLTAMDHPNVVRIFNFVEHPDPVSGELVGYIVMEYVGGRSLQQLLDAHRREGTWLPLPHAIAYTVDILAAFGYLHGLEMVYCDLKPDNVIQTGERLKLIDLGAVRRFDDPRADVFGTHGYQAPAAELIHGPTIASDLYTVGRTLAKLSFDFREMRGRYEFELPNPRDVDVLRDNESLYRVMLRATDRDATRRFSSADEMAEQLTGVLREVLSADDGMPREARSALFTPELGLIGEAIGEVPTTVRHEAGTRAPERLLRVRPAARAASAALPVPQVDGADPAAGLLATVTAVDLDDLLRQLAGFPADSVEVMLRRARARIEYGALGDAGDDLDEAEQAVPGDWRVCWYRGLLALAGGGAQAADEQFDAVYGAYPGELAPKLALGVCAEIAGDLVQAERRYLTVWRTSRSFVSAAFGLARVRLARGDRAGAIAVLDEVPRESRYRVAAGVAAVRACLETLPGSDLPAGPGQAPRPVPPLPPTEAELRGAARRLPDLGLDDAPRERLTALVREAARRWLRDGRPGPRVSGAVPDRLDVLGADLTERGLRLKLEHSYRTLAKLTNDPHDRIALVDLANEVRPRTLV